MSNFSNSSLLRGSNEPLQVDPGFTPLKIFGHRFQQTVLPIFAIAEGNIIPLGTGFIISQDGFMITAKHVIDEVFEKRLLRRDGTGRIYKDVQLYAMYVTNNDNKEHPGTTVGGPWSIDRAWYAPELDIAYCWLKQAEINGKPYKFETALRLSPGYPKIGENILGFGYYKSKASFANKIIRGLRVVDYSQETAFTSGKVTEVFHPYRDKYLLNFPCFQTTARFDSGMSGGPIFNGTTGGVCGVICDSFGEADDKGEYTSYGSLIWPSLAIQLEALCEGSSELTKFTAYEAIQRGYFKADDTFKKLKLMKNGDKISITINKSSS